MSRRLTNKVLLIGWDGADWKVASPLMDSGQMPNLEKFVSEGVMGNIATLYPGLSPMLWTSIATGKRPFKHGIYGFIEPTPDRSVIRPITNLSRKTKAIWNILSQEGLRCNVIGWWPSHPAEPINGVMVSNRYQLAVGPIDKPWPMRPGTVHPPRLTEALAGQRVHPGELETTDIGPFLPRIAEIDQDKDKRVGKLAKILAETASIHSAATAVMQLEPWDFMAVYYDGLDHFCHLCMNCHPPRLEWVDREAFELYQDVVRSAYRFHDMMLGALMGLVDEETTVVIVSDHGFHSDHLRPRNVPFEPAGPVAQHRHFGIFAMRGPGIKVDQRVYGVSLLDVCPTILAVLGRASGQDMDGAVIVNAFVEPPEIETIPSWDKVPGEAGMHPPQVQIDPAEAKEAVDQLVALGYIDKPDENAEKAVAMAVRELDYNLALAYMDAGWHAEAAPRLEDLLAEYPDQYRFGIQLVRCYQALGRVGEARALLETLLERKEENAFNAGEELKTWIEEHKEIRGEDLTEAQLRQVRELRAEAATNPYAINYLLGSLLFSEGNENDALGCLLKAEAANPNSPDLYNKVGEVYLAMRRLADADRSFARAIEIDPENAAAHAGLARVRLRQRRNAEAAEEALAAVALVYFNPQAHFLLAVALHRLNRLPRAVEALNVAVTQNPNFSKAYRRLAYIYDKRFKDPRKAAGYRRLAREATKMARRIAKSKGLPVGRGGAAETAPLTVERIDPTPRDLPIGPVDIVKTVTVVSGLPRSGTSMMMQMLSAGGLEPLTDGARPPDQSNEKGYYEYARAKSLRRDSSWVSLARGKAVKIIAQLLPALPTGEDCEYRVVFMERDLGEVVASQRDMIAAEGTNGARLSDVALQGVFDRQLQAIGRLLAARRTPILYISHRDCLCDPAGTAARVNAFLGGSLDERAMATVVEPTLYRHRAGDLAGTPSRPPGETPG